MSAWGKVNANTESVSFADIMSEEHAHRLQRAEKKRFGQSLKEREKLEIEAAVAAVAQSIVDDTPSGSQLPIAVSETSGESEWEDYSTLCKAEREFNGMDSDEVIARMLQAEYDHEYNKQLERVERQRNGKSKISVSLNNYRRPGDSYEFSGTEDEIEEDEEQRMRRDWDRFETNEKRLDAIPKCGFKLDEMGEMITKHDSNLCGVRNACRVMSFPPEVQTGDAAGFDMKLSNRVFNQLKTYSRAQKTKKNKQQDRKVDLATAEMGLDARTRLLLYKLINNQVLEQINGIISTGKEAVILHANSDPNYAGTEKELANKALNILPRECAVKIFKTTLNEFKQRDRYIKDDYRFKDRFGKQNKRVVINMWAEKEMHNMMRMQMAGINCPDVVMLKQHVLVMSFIGDNHNAAPKLKDARLNNAEWECAYAEVVETMHKLYNEAKLVHADLSEYNILWHDGKCWFIDVAQSVEPEHPSALEFLMRDCNNIVTFFGKRHLADIFTKEQLFEHITALNAENHNVAMLERIHTRGATIGQATAPNLDHCPIELKPLEFPFDLAWEKQNIEKLQQKCTLEEIQRNNISTDTIAPLITVFDGNTSN